MIEISWKDPDWVQVDTLEIVWKDASIPNIPLKLHNGYWNTAFSLSEKMQCYRLQINHSFSIIDRSANMYVIDENEKLWSICMRNDAGAQLYNITEYQIEVNDFYMTDHIDQWHIKKKDNKYIPPSDKMVVTHMTIHQGSGLHAITMLYINPNNEIIDLCEQAINLDSLEEEKLEVWFQRELNLKSHDALYGRWKAVLLIDGEFDRVEDYHVDQNISYSIQV